MGWTSLCAFEPLLQLLLRADRLHASLLRVFQVKSSAPTGLAPNSLWRGVGTEQARLVPTEFQQTLPKTEIAYTHTFIHTYAHGVDSDGGQRRATMAVGQEQRTLRMDWYRAVVSQLEPARTQVGSSFILSVPLPDHSCTHPRQIRSDPANHQNPTQQQMLTPNPPKNA